MGLSFSSYRKELSSRGFRRAYEGLRSECRELFPFAEPGDLIAFFHDQAADLTFELKSLLTPAVPAQ